MLLAVAHHIDFQDLEMRTRIAVARSVGCTYLLCTGSIPEISVVRYKYTANYRVQYVPVSVLMQFSVLLVYRAVHHYI